MKSIDQRSLLWAPAAGLGRTHGTNGRLEVLMSRDVLMFCFRFLELLMVMNFHAAGCPSWFWWQRGEIAYWCLLCTWLYLDLPWLTLPGVASKALLWSFKCNETWAALVSIIISLLAKAAVIWVPLFQWWLLRCENLTSVIMCDLVIPLVYIFSWRCSCCSASVVLLLLTFCVFKGGFWRFEGTIVPHAGWSCLLVGGKLFVQLC